MYNHQLETFIRVADAGSFNKAAEESYITPTAIIKQINLLEDSLGVKLFKRARRGLTLTKAGRSMYQDAKYIIQYCHDSVIRARNANNQTENKTYNVGFSFANEFISDYPNCLYDIKSELNIQAITPCRIYICSSELLLQEFEENKENQRIARIAAEQLFFQSYSRYLDLFRFTSEERYLQLLKKCPEILQMVPLKEIASYLKITPIHMSRIRHKQSFDSKE